MIDYHVHLWPHEKRAEPDEQRIERLTTYCEVAASQGVEEIALTEHLFRFTAAWPIADNFWRNEAKPEIAQAMAAYFDHHATADLDDYVEKVLAAKAAELPIVLGMEVDYYPGKMDEVAKLLAGYPFDVLLGSVHWLGSWLFDALEDEVSMREWDSRAVNDVWKAYTEAMEELASSRAVDVFAHPDVIKLTGAIPDAGYRAECEARIAEAAKLSGLAAEISSAGYRKPIGEAYPSTSLLNEFYRRAVPITTASDAHGPAYVGSRSSELADIARGAGYGSLRAFSSRKSRDVPISSALTTSATRT